MTKRLWTSKPMTMKQLFAKDDFYMECPHECPLPKGEDCRHRGPHRRSPFCKGGCTALHEGWGDDGEGCMPLVESVLDERLFDI